MECRDRNGLERYHWGCEAQAQATAQFSSMSPSCQSRALLIIIPYPINQIKILQAGWIRDGTWPRGGIPPDPDDELPMDEDGQVTTEAATPISPDALSRVTTPAIGHDSPGPSLHHHQFIWNTGTPVER